MVDGHARAMVGGASRHDVICDNLRGQLWTQLRGSGRRLQGPDLKLRTGDNARHPDALIDCGPFMQTSLVAQHPVAVFEILSKSTAWIDQTLKLRDDEATDSIRSYVLIRQDEPRVLMYQRDAAGRLGVKTALLLLEGLGESLTLPDPAVLVPLSLLYEGIEFEPASA